jgi:hypothetical protein
MKNPSTLQLRHLERQHQNLEAALDSLLNQPHLTPDEYQRARELKKRKLVAKDGIAALLQSIDPVSRGTAPSSAVCAALPRAPHVGSSALLGRGRETEDSAPVPQPSPGVLSKIDTGEQRVGVLG